MSNESLQTQHAPSGDAEHVDLPIVEMRTVDLRFEQTRILEGLNLSVARTERLVILGQSGAGKSTLLRLLLGVLRPTSGEVFFNGKNILKLPPAELNAIRSKIGMVYQYSALISSLSVRDNLALPLEELTRKKRAEIDHIVAEKLALVGMEETGSMLPAELSGGMRKRVAIARALVMEPELLLFDEPSAGLDPVVSAVVDDLIINLTVQTRATSIVVTHEMDSAFRIATRMAMLYKGRIIEEDLPDRFRRKQNPVVAQFIQGRAEGPIQ
jgi:phospholipid/cholesterol/gamma-HCH transport system ATP-binding protein